MQLLSRFFSVEDCFKDGIKKFIPNLSDHNEIETDYRFGETCPTCGESQGAALFFRLKGVQEWNPAIEVYECRNCRDKAALVGYREKSLNEQKLEIRKRLTAEYFIIPENLKEMGFQEFKETNSVTARAKKISSEYVTDFLNGDKYNLLLMGNPGTGKSHLCVAIAKNLQIKGVTVGFTTTVDLLAKIKGTFTKGAKMTQEGIMSDLKKLDLVILDDVGSESVGGSEDWRKSMLFEIVNSRIGKPTIYTSNLTDLNLPFTVGDRVFSRLYNNTKFIDLFTDDYRKWLRR